MELQGEPVSFIHIESDDKDNLLSNELFSRLDMDTKLFYSTPASTKTPWVFWSPKSLTSCQASNSLGIDDKIISALQRLEVEDNGFPILIQFWAPVIIDERHFLSTSEQRFCLTKIDEKLGVYRKQSMNYKFVVDGVREQNLGLPARVFRQKMPELTPHWRYYSSKEHPWCHRASDYGGQEFLALPVFEPFGQYCAGVLEAVDLKYIGGCNNFDEEIRLGGLEHALDEISLVLKVVCKTHDLPLAQTWVPCRHCTSLAHSHCSIPEQSCTLSDAGVMSKIDAYYAASLTEESFWSSTNMLHLQKGRGIAGRAYSSHNACFCTDISQFSLTDYPLLHCGLHSRLPNLAGCFAICLRSSYTGEDDYILEFFFPPSETKDGDSEKSLLDSILLTTMKQHFHSFKVASGEELGDELSVEIIKPSMNQKWQTAKCPPRPEALQNGGEGEHVDSSYPQLMVKMLVRTKRTLLILPQGKKAQ